MEKSQKKYDWKDLEQVTASVLGLQVFTGYNTASAFWSKRKRQPLHMMLKTNNLSWSATIKKDCWWLTAWRLETCICLMYNSGTCKNVKIKINKNFKLFKINIYRFKIIIL